jgi:hypothetical protein
MADTGGYVPVDGKVFVGIGKFVFSTGQWTVPHLHFMVDETPRGEFEATNLEFGLVASGASQEQAAEGLAILIHSHITAVINEGSGYDELITAVKTHAMDGFWAVYREMDFSLGKQGKDLSHEIDRHITKAIQAAFDMQIKNIISQKAGKEADEIIRMYNEVSSVKFITVQYTKIPAAA